MNDISSLFKDLKRSESLIFELFKFSFVDSYYLKNFSNFTNTKNIELLKKLNIESCLKCGEKWGNVVAHKAHNISKEIMLGNYIYKRNKIIVLNSTRPFTLKHLNIKSVNERTNNINSLLEDIEDVSTFGGICSNCDNIYNKSFEENKNLDFNNKEHLKLLIERSSFFKFYREALTTEIIKSLINLKRVKKVKNEEWESYIKICKKIKENELIIKRNSFYSKENIIIKNQDDFCFIKKELLDDKGFMLTDILYDNNSLFLINVFGLNNKEIFIISSKAYFDSKFAEDVFKNHIQNIDIKSGRNKIEFKDVIINHKYFFEESLIDLNTFNYYVIDNLYIYFIFFNQIYIVKLTEMSKILKINKDKFILNCPYSKKVLDNKYIHHYFNFYEYIEIDIQLVLNSCSWYLIEKDTGKLKRKDFERTKKWNKNLLSVYKILI